MIVDICIDFVDAFVALSVFAYDVLLIYLLLQ